MLIQVFASVTVNYGFGVSRRYKRFIVVFQRLEKAAGSNPFRPAILLSKYLK